MRVAEPIHARGALERAASLLQRGGWRAVFTARLIPGLRVFTTQLLIGVLVTFPYASFVGAYLAGRYARLTDRPVLRAEAVDG